MSDSAASPYFTSVPHPPAPTVPYPRQHPRPSSSPLRAEYTIAAIRRTPQNPPASARISTPSGRMVNYARQSSQNVVAAALMPSQERPKFEAKRFNSALPPIPSPNSTTVNKTPTSGKRSSASVDADKLDDYDITSSDAEIREVRKKSRRRRSPSIESSTKGDDEDHGKTSRRHRKLKSTAKKTSKPCKSSATRATPLNSRNKGLAVPKSFDDATESDRVMFKMRNEGKSWDEIRDRWIQMTGERPGRSTLSVRYCKLKANLSKTGGADDVRLLKFKKQVEDDFESEKWDRIAQKISNDGGQKYAPALLQSRFRALEKNDFHIGSYLQASSKDATDRVTATEVELDEFDLALAGLDGDTSVI